MSDRGRLMRRMGGALALGVLGLTMLLYALERTSLMGFAAGGQATPPLRIYLTMFVGLAILNLCVFFSLSQWARYLREHPDTPQLPVWFLVALLVVSGGALLTAIATHAGWLRAQESVPMDPNMGYIAFQVVMATLIVVSLVLLGVRWAPGYKHRLSES